MIQHVVGKVRLATSERPHRCRHPTLTGGSFTFFQWAALFAPAGPGGSSAAADAAAADPRFVSAMATVETPIQYLDAPELARFWAADAQKLGETVRRVGKVE